MRSLTLPTHSLLELLAGAALVGAALALAFGATATVVLFAAGVLLMGLALADPASLRAHRTYDLVMVVVLGAGAVAVAAAGDGLAAVTLVVFAGLQLTLTSVTRWSRPG